MIGKFTVERRYLVPGDGCVLSVTVFDEGDPKTIDDESWDTLWIEIPESQPLKVPFDAQARSHGFNVWGLDDHDNLIDVRVTVFSRNARLVSASVEFKDPPIRSDQKELRFFVVTEPSEENLRRP